MIENLNPDRGRRLPPLNALRAFEAAARHGSLSKAADELSVTPGAVSQQIRQLEETLGLSLFRRHARGVALTEEAAAALPMLSDSFDRMREACEVLAGVGDQTSVRIGAPPAFARKWLTPRLAAFETARMGADSSFDRSGAVKRAGVTLATDVAAGDLERLRVDVEVRFEREPPSGMEARRLLTETLSPVIAPALLARFGDGAGQAALLRAPLLHDVSPDRDPASPEWADWLAAAGLERPEARAGDRFTQADHVVDAAVAGRGVALARRTLAYDDLAAGRLETILVGGVTELPLAFSICWPKGRKLGQLAQELIDYLLAEAAPFEHMGV